MAEVNEGKVDSTHWPQCVLRARAILGFWEAPIPHSSFLQSFKGICALPFYLFIFLNRDEAKHKWLLSPHWEDVFLELNYPFFMSHSIPNVNKSFCELAFSKTNTFSPLCSSHFLPFQLLKNSSQGTHQTYHCSWNIFTYSLECLRVIFPTALQYFWIVDSNICKPVDPLLTFQELEDPFMMEVLLTSQQILPGPR